MISYPAQITGLYFIAAVTVAAVAVLLVIILSKSKQLDSLKSEFSKRELSLNKKLYETSVVKNKLEMMVESMTEGVFMVNKQLKLIVANSASKEMLGIDENRSVTIFDMVRGFDEAYPIEETISKVFDTREIVKVSEIRVEDKYIQITVIPIEVAEDVPGVGVLLHDQTDEQKLMHQHEEFTAMIVHELRSPLTVIKGTADTLIRNDKKIKVGAKKELLEQIKDTSEDLLTIVNTLLTDTKDDRDKYDIHKKKNDINDLLQEEVSNYSTIATDKGLELNLDLDQTIPDFEFDKVKITQVMNNLLSNALKFTHEGAVAVKSTLDGKLVRVEVADTGVGIPDDKKSELFQKFVQIHEGKDSDGPGTGLGLAISKGIVEAHGGKIWVENNKPIGTRLIFTIPTI